MKTTNTNSHTASHCIAVVVMGVAAAGCGHRVLRVYTDVTIRSEAVARRTDLPGLGARHVLESGSGVVLDVFVFDQGKRLTFDDEVCSTVLIAIPRSALKVVPARIENPVSYLDTCSCTWRICREEAAQGGIVRIHSAAATSIQADVDLRFSRRSIRVSGKFQTGSPAANLLPLASP
jgi:hypothetical protein